MRLIDADALKKDIEENAIVLGGVQSIEVECAKALIDNTPTVPLRLMTVEECAGHTIDYAMGWKACIEWIKKGGAE